LNRRGVKTRVYSGQHVRVKYINHLIEIDRSPTIKPTGNLTLALGAAHASACGSKNQKTIL